MTAFTFRGGQGEAGRPRSRRPRENRAADAPRFPRERLGEILPGISNDRGHRHAGLSRQVG